MSFECAYKNIDYCHSEIFKVEDCLCDTSLIVPDAKSDIVKVLSVTAFPYVSDTKAESGRITINGQVKFNILYIGEGENSDICSVNTTAPFSHLISVNMSQNALPFTTITSFNAEHTLVNSRKIKVSSLMKLCVTVYENKRQNILTSASGAQIKCKEEDFYFLSTLCRKNIPVTETVDLPGLNGEIKSLLHTSACVSDCDYKILNNKAIIKGNIQFTALYQSADIHTSTVSFPFTEVFEAEGLSPDNNTTIDVFVSDCDASPDTDLSGEYKMLNISLILSADVISFKKEDSCVVSDIYLPRKRLKTESCQIPVQSLFNYSHEEEFVKETIRLNPSQPAIEKILSSHVLITEVAVEGNTVNAVALTSILYRSSDSSINCHSVKIPFAHKLSQSNIKTVSPKVKHEGYVISDGASIELRLSIDFSVLSVFEESITVFTLCEECEHTPEKRPSVVVSCINKSCSMWDVAKKYNIPVSALASANAMDENSSLSSGCKLIIPR